jgi:hypothetical protein
MVDLMSMPAASGESYDDNEQVSFTGPGVLVVTGFQGATTTYEIEVTGN